jgi:hypothetical protein
VGKRKRGKKKEPGAIQEGEKKRNRVVHRNENKQNQKKQRVQDIRSNQRKIVNSHTTAPRAHHCSPNLLM